MSPFRSRFFPCRVWALSCLALGRIKAKTLVVPFSQDMFFPPADCEAEQTLIPNSKFRIVESLWAHFAMFCMTTSDREQIDACIRDLLNEPA